MAGVSFDVSAKVDKALAGLKQIEKSAKQTTSAVEGINDTFSKLQGIFGAAIIGVSLKTIAGAIGTVTKAAAEAEEANSRLSAALRQTGRFAEGTAEIFASFADEIQNTTRFEDDLVKSNIATLASLTNLNEKGLKDATRAATNLAIGLKIDLGSAFDLIGKAANGNVAALNRNNIKVREGATASETFANALASVNKAFGGAAANDLNTYSGKVEQLNNLYSELLETIGGVFIKNKEVNRLLQEAATGIRGVTDEANGSAGALDKFISGLIKLGESTIKLVGYIPIVAQFQFAYKKLFQLVQKVGEEAPKVKGFGDLKLIEAAETARLAVKVFEDVPKALADQIKNVETVLKNAGKSQVQIARDTYAEQSKIIKDAVKFGFKTKIEGDRLLVQAQLKLGEELKKAKEKETKDLQEQFEKQKKLAEDQSKFVSGLGSLNADSVKNFAKGTTGGVDENGQPIAVNQTGEAGAALALGVVNKALTGTQGVLDVFSTAMTAFLGPLGGIAAGLLGVLSKGPEAAAAFVTEFIKSIPAIIQSIIEAIPAIIEAFFELLPDLIAKLIEIAVVEIPKLVAKLAELMPQLVQTLTIELIKKVPEIIGSLVRGTIERIPSIVTSFSTELIKQSPIIAIGMAKEFIRQIPMIATEFVKALVEQISSIGGLLGSSGSGGEGGSGLLGGVTKFVSNPIGAIGDIFGFAEGGLVPDISKYSGDNFPARLSGGEFVIDRTQNQQLQEFLDSFSASNTPTTVTLQVGEQQLASVMLNLDRNNYRTKA